MQSRHASGAAHKVWHVLPERSALSSRISETCMMYCIRRQTVCAHVQCMAPTLRWIRFLWQTRKVTLSCAILHKRASRHLLQYHNRQAMTTKTPSSRTIASWDIIAPGTSHSLLCQMRPGSRHCYNAAATRPALMRAWYAPALSSISQNELIPFRSAHFRFHVQTDEVFQVAAASAAMAAACAALAASPAAMTRQPHGSM